jgi:hypothetical protein
VEPLKKFVPVTVSVKGAPPAAIEVALSEVIVGPTTFRVDAADVVPPGLCTVRLSLPVVATMLAGMVAVMDVAVPAVTVNAIAPEKTSEPGVKFPLPSVIPAMKLVPVTVIVVGSPAGIEMGLTDETVGPPTVNVLAEEDAVLEFWTVTFADAAEAYCELRTAAVIEVDPK